MNKTFHFHDGLSLPAGTRIAFPIGAIQKDPANFSSPTTFNGYRFIGARSNQSGPKDNEFFGSAQTVTTTNLVYVLHVSTLFLVITLNIILPDSVMGSMHVLGDSMQFERRSWHSVS